MHCYSGRTIRLSYQILVIACSSLTYLPSSYPCLCMVISQQNCHSNPARCKQVHITALLKILQGFAISREYQWKSFQYLRDPRISCLFPSVWKCLPSVFIRLALYQLRVSSWCSLCLNKSILKSTSYSPSHSLTRYLLSLSFLAPWDLAPLTNILPSSRKKQTSP